MTSTNTPAHHPDCPADQMCWCPAGQLVPGYADSADGLKDAADQARADSCPVCQYPLAEHIGHKPCIQSAPGTAKSLYDLPIFGWAWTGDAKQVER